MLLCLAVPSTTQPCVGLACTGTAAVGQGTLPPVLPHSPAAGARALTAAVQSEAVFLRQKGSVLEQLLEVASEVAVHKRQHTGTKFPDLSDPQLLEFLEKFLDGYGGFAAERPTAHNYFNLQR